MSSIGDRLRALASEASTLAAQVDDMIKAHQAAPVAAPAETQPLQPSAPEKPATAPAKAAPIPAKLDLMIEAALAEADKLKGDEANVANIVRSINAIRTAKTPQEASGFISQASGETEPLHDQGFEVTPLRLALNQIHEMIDETAGNVIKGKSDTDLDVTN